jgi:hypothetical protein
MPTVSVEFNTNTLRNKFIDRGLSIAAFARQSGISEEVIGVALRNGRCEVETLRRIALALKKIPTIRGIEELRDMGPVKRRSVPDRMVGPMLPTDWRPMANYNDEGRIVMEGGAEASNSG